MTEYHNRVNSVGQIKKSDWWLIGTVWFFVQLTLVFYLGINSQQESLKYIGLADSWVRGQAHFNWNQVFYAGYIGIHVVLNLLGLPPQAMYFIQLILSGLAALYFVRIICLFIQFRPVIILSAILYSTCFFIQQWVCALFTDSVFGSLLIISIYYLLTDRKTTRNNLISWILLILLPFFRPVGFLFIILACIYWLVHFNKVYIPKLVFFSIYLILTGMVIYKSLADNPSYFYPRHNIEANIICGYPGNLLIYQRSPYRESMGMVAYIMENPGMFLRLYFLRFAKVFSLTRDYFSWLHNLLLNLTCSFYLLLALAGCFSSGRKKLLIFLLSGIFLFSIPSVIFCVEWSGRFSLPVYCFVLLLGSLGLNRIPGLRHSSSS